MHAKEDLVKLLLSRKADTTMQGGVDITILIVIFTMASFCVQQIENTNGWIRDIRLWTLGLECK